MPLGRVPNERLRTPPDAADIELPNEFYRVLVPPPGRLIVYQLIEALRPYFLHTFCCDRCSPRSRYRRVVPAA